MKEHLISVIIVCVLTIFLIHSYVLVHDGAIREQKTLDSLDKISKWIEWNNFEQVCE